jgi:ADP-heptose:LPS heptosyltransferase
MRLLLIRFSSLGDVILTSSVLPFLYKEGFKVELLTFKPFGELFRNHPHVSRVIEVSREELRGISQIRELAKELKGYQLGIDLHCVLRSRLLRFYLPFKTIGYPKRSSLRRLMVVFKPFKAKWLFVPELYGEAVRKLGIKVTNPRPYLKVDRNSLERVREFLPKEDFLVIAPGARWESKSYPIEGFKELTKILTRNGFQVVAVGGKGEFEKGREIEKAGGVNLCGKLSLTESLAAISLSRGVVANDSAVVHMARSVKKPVVAIFGPTHPAFGFAPAPDEGRALTLNLPCSPCSLHGRTKCKERKCFKIPPERVATELLSTVRRRGEA